jgi:SPP1 gp7 family putative phage head morphogenesis protein
VANRTVYNTGLNLIYQRGIDHGKHCTHPQNNVLLNEIDGWEIDFEKLMTKVFNAQIDEKVNRETAIWKGDVLTEALTEGYGQSLMTVDYDTPDFEMLRQLQANVWSFSCASDYQMCKDLTAALVDANGKQRTFAEFKAEADKIGKVYNSQRLQVEYNHAVASSQMAARWVDYELNEDIAPNLKYVTAGDDRVRQAHKALEGIIKPIKDSFWDKYYPPNDWGCRCDVQAVDADPTEIEKALPNVPKMFATNLSKSGVLYPAGHPYFAYEEYWDEQEVLKTANALYAKQTRSFVRDQAKEKYKKDAWFNVPYITDPVRVGYSEIKNVTGKPHKNASLRNLLAGNIDQVFKQMEFVSEAKDIKPESHKGKYIHWYYFKLNIGRDDFYINIAKKTDGTFELHAINDIIK